MDIRDCIYTSVKKRGIGNTLRMGQACVPFRWVVANLYVMELTRSPLVIRERKNVSSGTISSRI